MPTLKKNGKFITLEGGEGAGKSTQSRLLAEYLRGQGHEVVQTREVGGCTSAEAIRKLWLEPADDYWDEKTEILLVFAARREHWVKIIAPALEEGAFVICDRFVDSTKVYQGMQYSDWIDKLQNQIEARDPDLTILLDMDIHEGLERALARGDQNDRFQQKDFGVHHRIRDSYLELAKSERFAIVTGKGSKEEVATLIRDKVRERFKLP